MRDARDHHFGLFRRQGATFAVHGGALGSQGEEVVPELRYPEIKQEQQYEMDCRKGKIQSVVFSKKMLLNVHLYLCTLRLRNIQYQQL